MPCVLVVDDSASARELVQMILSEAGFRVITAPDGRRAIQVLRKRVIELIITDIYMPGMTGLDLLEHLRAKGDTTPALMMTGRSDPSLEPRATRIGVKLLHKPVPEEQLLSWIEQTRLASA